MARSILIFFGVLFFQLTASAQLKKSYYGKYVGNIPAYEINTGMEKIRIAPAEIEVRLSAGELALRIGTQEWKGSWEVLFEAGSYFVLNCKLENQLAPERIIVYKKGRKISREGIRPQPDAMLVKSKR